MGRPVGASESGPSQASMNLADASDGPLVSADRVAYMADLILELADMATAEGHATLAGLLTLAHQEARIKSEASRR